MPGNALFISDPDAFYNVLFTLAAALIVSFAVTPLVRMLAHKVGAVDDPNRDERRIHTSPVPRLGGLAIFIGFIVAFLVFGFGELNRQMAGILIGAVIILVLGAIDDILTLPWWVKLAGQLTAALIPVLCGLRIGVLTAPFITADGTINLGVFNAPITILWIIGITNAVNLIDGLDGLAAGIVAISAFAFFLYAYWLTVVEDLARAQTASLVAVVICAVCVGYLPHNFHPATIFMGDSGSMLLGLMFAASMISLTSQIDPSTLGDNAGLFGAYIPLIMPFVALGLPVLDMLILYVKRTWKGRWWFVPDKQHLHHRLLERGYSQVEAVLAMYAWTLLLACSALALGLFPSWITGGIVIVVLCCALVFILFGGGRLLKKIRRRA